MRATGKNDGARVVGQRPTKTCIDEHPNNASTIPICSFQNEFQGFQFNRCELPAKWWAPPQISCIQWNTPYEPDSWIMFDLCLGILTIKINQIYLVDYLSHTPIKYPNNVYHHPVDHSPSSPAAMTKPPTERRFVSHLAVFPELLRNISQRSPCPPMDNSLGKGAAFAVSKTAMVVTFWR